MQVRLLPQPSFSQSILQQQKQQQQHKTKMNAQHQLCRKANRARRLIRRTAEIKQRIDSEKQLATDQHREPNCGFLYDHLNRVDARLFELLPQIANRS